MFSLLLKDLISDFIFLFFDFFTISLIFTEVPTIVARYDFYRPVWPYLCPRLVYLRNIFHFSEGHGSMNAVGHV